uniref:WGS project CAEQ00000000 data, annotated contig 243 n=1 Tax=Trypanosoma congolense (strain IL3000) TaxID=1068625 RepID=F9WE33_TRYCI|nr:unnamed protein product [Trypanosoma congolense IL3000]
MSSDEWHIVERLSSAQQRPISEPHRFTVLVLAALCCICVSFLYTFNLVSGAIQSRYNLTQGDMSTITTVGIVVGYFGLPYSFVYDHFGPRPIFVLGFTVFTIGALLLALTFQGIVEGSVVRLSVLNAFMTLGTTLFDMAVMVTLLSHFPSNRGAVIAILKTLVGLGSAIVGSIRLAFFSKNTSAYFYFMMTSFIAAGVLGAIYVRLPAYHLTGYEENHLTEEVKSLRLMRKAVYLRQKAPVWRFAIALAVLITLIVLLPVQGALVAYLKLGDNYRLGFSIVVIVLTLLLPLAALPTTKFDGPREINAPETKSPTDTSGPAGCVVDTDVDYIAPQFQEPFCLGLRTARLWCLLLTIFCCAGSLFVVMFNARFIYTALASEVPDEALNTLLTILNGTGSASGRLLMSYFEVWSQKRRAEDRIPITVALFAPAACIVTMLTLFLAVPKVALPLPFFIGAIANGFMGATIVLVSRTLFARDPAKHYYFCYVGSLLSAIFLNRLLYGEWYTREATKREETVCMDRVCVVMPLAFLLGMALLSLTSSTYVHQQYRALCRKALEERQRIRCEGGETSPPSPKLE